MNRIHIRNLGCGDHRRHIQIALRQPRRSNADGLVGKAYVQPVPVRLAIDGDRPNAEFTAGVDYAQCDFAAIGYQYFTKHSFPFSGVRQTNSAGLKRVAAQTR